MYLGVIEGIWHWASYSPNRVAIQTLDRVCTYRDLRSLALSLASRIDSQPNARIAVFSRDPITILSSILGIGWHGSEVVVLNPCLPPDILAQNIEDTQVSRIVVDRGHCLSDTQYKCIVFPESGTSSPQVIEYHSPHTAAVGVATLGQPWGVLFSSGTTGAPKGILHSYYSIWTELLCWIIELRLSRGDRFFVGRPIYYTGGLVLTMATLLVGGSVVAGALNDPNSVAETKKLIDACCRTSLCSWAFFTPQLAQALVAEPGLGERDLFPKILLMGAPVSHDQKVGIAECFGSEVIESWGNSEGLGTISFPEDWMARHGTVGRPFVSERIVVVDDQGKEVPRGTVGRVAGVDESYFTEYCGRPDATEAAKAESLVVSDDLGYMDDDGFLFLKGRKQQSLVHSGKTIFCAELERMLCGLSGVCEAAILPTVDRTPASGPQNCLLRVCIVPAARANRADVEKQVIESVEAQSGISRDLFAVRCLDAFPRTPSGKTDYSKL